MASASESRRWTFLFWTALCSAATIEEFVGRPVDDEYAHASLLLGRKSLQLRKPRTEAGIASQACRNFARNKKNQALEIERLSDTYPTAGAAWRGMLSSDFNFTRYDVERGSTGFNVLKINKAGIPAPARLAEKDILAIVCARIAVLTNFLEWVMQVVSGRADRDPAHLPR